MPSLPITSTDDDDIETAIHLRVCHSAVLPIDLGSHNGSPTTAPSEAVEVIAQAEGLDQYDNDPMTHGTNASGKPACCRMKVDEDVLELFDCDGCIQSEAQRLEMQKESSNDPEKRVLILAHRLYAALTAAEEKGLLKGQLSVLLFTRSLVAVILIMHA